MYFGNSLCAIFAGIAAGRGELHAPRPTPACGTSALLLPHPGHVPRARPNPHLRAVERELRRRVGRRGLQNLATLIAQMKRSPPSCSRAPSSHSSKAPCTSSSSTGAQLSRRRRRAVRSHLRHVHGGVHEGSSLFAIAVARLTSDRLLAVSSSPPSPSGCRSSRRRLPPHCRLPALRGMRRRLLARDGHCALQVVPEETRATINIFRVPLNAIVLGVLLSQMSTTRRLCTARRCCCSPSCCSACSSPPRRQAHGQSADELRRGEEHEQCSRAARTRTTDRLLTPRLARAGSAPARLGTRRLLPRNPLLCTLLCR